MREYVAESKAAPDRLWAEVSAVQAWPDVLPTFDAVRHIAGPHPPQVGTRFAVRQPGLVALTYEVTDWDPPRSFTWVGRTLGVTTTARHTVEPAPAGSRVTLGLDWSGPFAWLVRILFSAKASQMIASEGDTLARLAEQG
ncbi:MAG: SRPBCC family protein [Tetrasphaera sp.]|jgi:hypothetical protein|nr:SRPBCC family protein [Tetrasphaera sp.]